MSRYAAFIFFLSLGVVSQLSHGIEVEVKDGDKLCLYANLTLNFSVSYKVAENKSKTVSFELPNSAKSNDSKCGAASSILKLSFPEGHSWSVNFVLKNKSYQADVITFTYNLNDSNVFPSSSSNETVTVTAKPDITNVGLDTCYSCKSEDLIQASPQVNMTLSNVLVQAFVANGTKSENLTTCAADVPVTPSPTPHVTNATTVAPAPNTTTAVPPTTPTPTLPTPTIGNYSIKRDANSTACLLANFGLRIGFTQNKKYQEVNFDPPAEASGACGIDSSELLLASNDVTVSLTFTNDTKKFRLHAVNVTLNTSAGVFSQSSTNLSLWEATVGSSYMCNKEQNFTITTLLSLYTFSLHVQPFGVKNGIYSTGSFKRRKRKSITVTVMLLIVSVLILIFGLAATTRTQNITVGGYYPGVILGFGSFLGIIGAHLIENKRQMLVASIVFISFGAVAAFCCAIVDGVFAARHIDLRPLHAGRCEYLSNEAASERDVSCYTPRSSCKLHVKSNTCYCCDLYNCGREPLMGLQNKDVLKKFRKSSMIWNRAEVMGGYHEYTDVKSCQDVVHLYYLLWSATILNIVALFLGIITAAVLGGFKDMMPAPASESTSEPEAIAAPVPPAPPPPTTSLHLYHNTAPCLPPYTAYDLQGSYLFPDSSGLSDDSQSGASHLWPTLIPPRYSPPHEHPDEKPPPYSP